MNETKRKLWLMKSAIREIMKEASQIKGIEASRSGIILLSLGIPVRFPLFSKRKI